MILTDAMITNGSNTIQIVTKNFIPFYYKLLLGAGSAQFIVPLRSCRLTYHIKLCLLDNSISEYNLMKALIFTASVPVA